MMIVNNNNNNTFAIDMMLSLEIIIKIRNDIRKYYPVIITITIILFVIFRFKVTKKKKRI